MKLGVILIKVESILCKKELSEFVEIHNYYSAHTKANILPV